MKYILDQISQERKKQTEKWGEQNHSPTDFIAILTEEVGEAAKEAVDLKFRNPVKERTLTHVFTVDATDINQQERLMAYREELIQVAAVAVQMIEAVDRGIYSDLVKH